MERVIVGVVGVLQFEVLEYRLLHEYNVEVRRESLPYEYIRWVVNRNTEEIKSLNLTSGTRHVQDLKGNNLLLFANSWGIQWALDHNEGLELAEFSKN